MRRQEGFACLICGDEGGRLVLRRPTITLAACEGCGFVQQQPVPTVAEIAAMYAEEAGYLEHLLIGEGHLLERDRRVLADLAARGASGPLLDVGAGAGFLLRAARERGWEAIGLELSRPSIEHVRARIDATVHEADIDDAPLQRESIGAVTLSHSLEHVRDPVATLRRAREVLRPGGLIFVAVPNWRAGTRVALGGRISWVHPCHVSYFQRDTLERAFVEAGLEPLAFESRPFLGVDYPLAVDFARRLGLERPAQRFLRLGDRPLDVLIGDDLRLDCPPWRLRLLMRVTHALLAAWPESLCIRLGRGQELRGIARRPA